MYMLLCGGLLRCNRTTPNLPYVHHSLVMRYRTSVGGYHLLQCSNHDSHEIRRSATIVVGEHSYSAAPMFLNNCDWLGHGEHGWEDEIVGRGVLVLCLVGCELLPELRLDCVITRNSRPFFRRVIRSLSD